MCRTDAAILQPQPQAVNRARLFLTERLTEWRLPEDTVDVAVLLASEAVTNAVVHARTTATITVAVDRAHVEIAVDDLDAASLALDHRRRQVLTGGLAQSTDPLAESGRGLLMLDTMAEDWGVRAYVGGKQVWFRLATERTPHGVLVCGCDDPDPASRRSAVAEVDDRVPVQSRRDIHHSSLLADVGHDASPTRSAADVASSGVTCE